MRKLTFLLKRAGQIYQTEGLLPLLRRAVALIIRLFFEYQTYYIYAEYTKDLPELKEADFMPKTDDFIPKVVTSNEQADELEAQGFEFRSTIPNARKRLDSGAIAMCIFVGRELANIGWFAASQQAKDSLGEPPYKVDFGHRESVGGGLWTNPKYRRLGLRVYNRYMYLRLVLDSGIQVRRAAIAKGNLPTIRSRASFYHSPCAEGRYLRVLWWRSWKERPLAEDGQCES